MPNGSIKLSREADLILENLKLKARHAAGERRRIYKRDILNWMIKTLPQEEVFKKKFTEWLKKNGNTEK